MPTSLRNPGAMALALSLCVGACVKPDPEVGQTQQQSTVQIKGGIPVAPPAIKDRFLTWVGSSPRLPKWKTSWERELERKYQLAKAAGIKNADQYDTYRQTNIDKFYVTTPPTAAVKVPAEYDQSQTFLMTWPSYMSAGDNTLFATIVKTVMNDLPVLFAYSDAANKTFIETQLTAVGVPAADLANPAKVIWWQHKFNAEWSRDFGPLGIVSVATPAKLSFVDFRYYHDRIYDDEIPSDLAKDWGINVYRPDLDFEGGNFMNTSDGLCAATKGVLWANLLLSQSAVEDVFKKFMGCKKMIFPQPLQGEGTTHIDMFSKFLSDTKVIVGEYTTAQDSANKAILDADANLYATTTNGSGAAVSAIRIPMPNKGTSGGETVWRTFTNSLALNAGTKKHMLVPVYSDETSQQTAGLAVYTTHLPGWTVTPIDSKSLIPYGGAIHCVTMQIPAGAKSSMETPPTPACGKQLGCITGCGSLTMEGCCDGQVLKYCNNNKPALLDCAGSPSCGWDATNKYYDCGTAGATDPSGAHPKSCNVVLDGPKVDMGPDKPPPVTNCGKVTTEGCCDGQTVWFCDNGVLSKIDCTQNPKCGWQASQSYYDCGTAGTADPSGTNPMACSGFFGDGGPPKLPDQAVPAGCGAVTAEGCCDGETLKYCDSGTLSVLDCSGNPKCGWDATNTWYDCGTAGAADPSGSNPKACPTGPAGDGSVKKDTGTTKTDKGTTPTPDKSVTPTPDQTVVNPDTFVPPADDQSVTPTADKGSTKKDAGTVKKGDDGGCSCAMGSEAQGSGWLLLGLALGVLGLRRRRS